MQFKGVVRFFLIAFSAVCLYQLMLMIPTNSVEKAADVYADQMAAKFPDSTRQSFYARYLDSMSTEKVFNVPGFKNYTYSELKKSQLGMGLDLKGGMSVLLQVDLRDFLTSLSGKSTDPAFTKSLDDADAGLKSQQADYITLFANAWKANSGGRPLAEIFARNESLRERIKFDTPDPEALRVIRELGNETVNETYKRLKQRIDKLGVVAPNVNLDAARDLINVELPGIDNPQRAREMLQKSAKLEFWECYRLGDEAVIKGFTDADAKLKALLSGDSTAIPATRKDTTYEYVLDANGNPDTTQAKQMVVKDVPNEQAGQGPLLKPDVLQLNGGSQNGQTALLGYADKNKIPLINSYLSRPEIKALFPSDLAFRWSQQPMESFEGGESIAGKYELYAIKKLRGSDDAPLDGGVVTQAGEQPDPTTGAIAVSLQMDNNGARTWAEMTTRMAQDANREVAIVLDNEVVSAPRVINPITGGSTQITGNFTLDEARDLANILEVGKLPATPRIVQESQVGPSLGKDNINSSLFTMILAVALLGIFMIGYYARGGVVAVLAMLLNILFMVGGLASMGTVLTLPGIAGIVLTLASAVDASVIIYERIREELRQGMNVPNAISVGFSRALPAITDANITTLLTAFVLMYFGLGPIKGFGTVLLVGILASMFCAILVARMMTDWWQTRTPDMTYSNKWSENWLVGAKFDWMGKRRYAYIFSAIVSVIAIGAFFTRKFELGVDFKGGYSFNIQFDKPVEIEALRAALSPELQGNPIIKQVSTANTFNVTTSYKINETGKDVIQDVMAAVHKGVEKAGYTTALDNFKSTDGSGTHIVSSTQVGPTVADDITDSSYKAGAWALALIFIYLLIRFQKWQFSAGAVIALAHDVIITLGFFSLLHGIVPFSLEIDQAIIACILTVIGYSVNDTVIVFDRIREFARTYAGRPKEEVLNLAINSTLTRTIITSGTVFGVVLLLFLFGGSAIKGFSFGIMIGMLFGTYSSVYIASAIALDLVKGPVLEGKEATSAPAPATETSSTVASKLKKAKA